MDFDAFLEEIRESPQYADQMVYVRDAPARQAGYAGLSRPLPPQIQTMLARRGISELYSHQAEAIEKAREEKHTLIVTGTASGKSLCYTVPILETLLVDPEDCALLLFPTKALCQDQFRGFGAALSACGIKRALAGVYDSDTPTTMRRKLRDHGSAVFTNPDMLHAGIMPEHARWARFLSRLKYLVIDELHTYNGIFGSNMGNVLRRFFRICAHYGSSPQLIACSATIGNPKELGEALSGREMALIDRDGSPRGKRTYVFWNPPRVRTGNWRSRRSANVEAHELMAMLIQHGVPTITFSKAKMTAEMIYRYVCEKLRETTPHLASKLTPYRGGYLPEERREIERRLFEGELLGVSTTKALELGIDVGGLGASILVGYPGTLASFFQQSGRAGRKQDDSLVVLVGLDTAVNQYIMSRPDYIFDRPMEEAVIDPDNPFVVTGHLRCATQELPLADSEKALFGPYADTVLRVLEDNLKVKRIRDAWYHAASETPQHEISLRDDADKVVAIEDVDTGKIIGEMNKYDAPPILHPDAIYIHHGDTYRVLELDLDRYVARVKRVEVDYYTQPLGGTDVHHIDHTLREKEFGTGRVYWGEVTAYFQNVAYEKVHFYSLDTISVHGLDLPKWILETMGLWITPPDALMAKVRQAGLDGFSGLRAVGYATRMMLPLFITCDAYDFSHSVGSANSPWNTLFIYERYPHGLGFTEKAYERIHEILPMVLEHVKACPCDEGCPCCVGKPLRQYSVWNVERGEASIPSKAAAIMIMEGLIADGANLQCADVNHLAETEAGELARVEADLRRRLERMREPQIFHPIDPVAPTGYPDIEPQENLSRADSAMRAERRTSFDKELRKRIAKSVPSDQLSPNTGIQHPPSAMRVRGNVVAPTHFPGRPDPPAPEPPVAAPQTPQPVPLGDSLAARARKLRKKC